MSAFDLSGLNILLLDDSRSIRQVLTTLLRGLGVTRIYESRDADEALVTARLCRPDLALVDYDLGVISGLEAVRRFRDARCSPRTDLPIILRGRRDRRHPAEAGQCSDIGGAYSPHRADRCLARRRTLIAHRLISNLVLSGNSILPVL